MHDPIDMELSFKEQFVYILCKDHNKEKRVLLVHDAVDLSQKHIVENLSPDFCGLYITSPLYAENFKKKLMLLEIYFERIYASFQTSVDLMKSQKSDLELNDAFDVSKMHIKVKFTRWGPRFIRRSNFFIIIRLRMLVQVSSIYL